MAIQGKSSSNSGGATQRASALAALNSAFTSSSASPKSGSAPRVFGKSQGGSQRAAAVAALSSVLTAEKKSPDDVSPARPRSPGTTEFLIHHYFELTILQRKP